MLDGKLNTSIARLAWFKLILASCFIFCALFSVAQAEQVKMLAGKRLVVIVKTSDVNQAGMAFSLAESALGKGAEVTIILGANASTFPFLKGGQDIFAAKEMTPREMLGRIFKRGGTVYICELCAEYKEFGEEELLAGVKIVKSKEIFAKMYEDNVRVMSY